MTIKKLIEVALPLEAINAESAREKSIRHGHPSTLHLWWARRPLAAARAVIWSSLVDDPSSHPDRFPTEEEQMIERQRLFAIIEKLVKWENTNNQSVLVEAKEEILRSTDGNPPKLLDPFAGGGTIPMEAQRLGLVAHASDLNPVAVMINKAMIEIPPYFAGVAPVNPETRATIGGDGGWIGAQGLAEDVRYYGECMKHEAFKRIGHLYPKVTIPTKLGGGEATVIVWIWARTVKCSNPACGCEMPLIRSFDMIKKKGKEIHVEPVINNSGLSFEVKKGKSKIQGTIDRRGAKCVCCNTPHSFPYIRDEAQAGRMKDKLLAVIAESSNGRIVLPPDEFQLRAADTERPEDYPDGPLPYNPRNFQTPLYGMTTFSSLFTNRQLTALNVFSDLVQEMQQRIFSDALEAGMPNDGVSLTNGGIGAQAYSQAICVYLAFAVDREANYCSSLNTWSGDFIVQTFGRQALPMVWDYCESNPFSGSTGNWSGAIKWICLAMGNFAASVPAIAQQFDAQSDIGLRNILVSTDPPYYNNIIYADISDYFYIWMRKSLKNIYPDIFRTLLVPKDEELVAAQYRFEGGLNEAKEFFERGMYNALCQVHKYVSDDYPLTLYYAYKQSESEETDDGKNISSSGWETMLSAIVNAGFMITGTWPIHTERETGLKASMNALASSIILVCRKRPEDALVCTRRNFINELKREIKPALINLQRSNIAPVDLAQSAIGPGMAVFSRFSKVLEADGAPMGVRSALQIINQELDVFFNEQDGELDRDSRFCVDLYSQCAFNDIKFGEADTLARAKNTSVAAMASRSVIYAQKGIVRLLGRDDIPSKVDTNEKVIWLLTQQLTNAMEKGGIAACAEIVAPMYGSNAEHAKALAYRLFSIADRKGWSQEAYAYNSLVVAWSDIQSRAAELKAIKPEQGTLFD